MKKISILFIMFLLTPIISFSALQYNSGDSKIKFFDYNVQNDSPAALDWIYGTWVNNTSVDKVYGRIRNRDDSVGSNIQYTGDAHLMLQEYSGMYYFTACTGGLSNLKPGQYISCYNHEYDNSGDTFRTNVAWSGIQDSSVTTDPKLYITTGIEGGYNVK